MNKRDKIKLIASCIESKRLARMYFKYDANYYYFYPNAVNERLVMGQEEDDFLLDGFQIRKVSDLVKVEIKDDLCPEINIWNGLADGIIAPEIDISSWKTVFQSEALRGKCIIICDDNGGELRIGYIKRACERYVSIYNFGANGEFDDEPYKFPYSKITSVAWNTRYAETWHKYLKAHDMLPDYLG